ncbi:MAG TPA: hypothetical protein VEI97_08540 [bacterium]|nr:hypothetical protein [bacterium]
MPQPSLPDHPRAAVWKDRFTLLLVGSTWTVLAGAALVLTGKGIAPDPVVFLGSRLFLAGTAGIGVSILGFALLALAPPGRSHDGGLLAALFAAVGLMVGTGDLLIVGGWLLQGEGPLFRLGLAFITAAFAGVLGGLSLWTVWWLVSRWQRIRSSGTAPPPT